MPFPFVGNTPIFFYSEEKSGAEREFLPLTFAIFMFCIGNISCAIETDREEGEEKREYF